MRSLEVLPPFVTVTNRRTEVSDLEAMVWRVELQANRLETLFDSEWETVARSPQQRARAIPDQPAAFQPLSMALNSEQTGPSAVYRVLVIVEWYTRNEELAGRGQMVATSYADGQRSTATRREGCHGVRIVA